MSLVVKVSAEGKLTVGCDDVEVTVSGSASGAQSPSSEPTRNEPDASADASGWPQDSAPDIIRKKRPRPADGNTIGANAQLVVLRRPFPLFRGPQLSSRNYGELHSDVVDAIRNRTTTVPTFPLTLNLGLVAGDVFDAATALEVVRHAAESENCRSVVLRVFVRGET
jgi:hypothetical protein